jgi:Zn-dependent protease
VDRPRELDERERAYRESEARRYRAREAPEAPSFPDPEPYGDGDRGYEPMQPRSGLVDLLKKLAAPIVALGFLIVKFGGLLLKLKVVTTGLSMAVSIAAYAWIWGLPFAVGFVLLILVHELGHVFELRRQGVPASAPLFIPFLGAVIGMKELPDDAWKEAKVALAGPILGSAAAAACWIAAEATGSEMLMGLAFVGFFLNLFNLIPIVPLDGGRAAGALHPALWFVGLLMMVGLVAVSFNPLLLIIVVLGGLDLWQRWRSRGDAGDYYRLSVGQRTAVAVVYLGLVAVLALAMSATYVEREF